MATATNKTTRRSVLGALAFIPAIAALPALASATAPGIDATRFNRRLATYRRLKDEQEAFYAANVTPLDEAHNRMPRETESPIWRAAYEGVIAAETQHDAYVDRMAQACTLMLLTPAPDHAALATKIETMIAEDAFSDAAAIIPVLLADVRRLGGEA